VSRIEWTSRTWNFFSGCTKCSEGCVNCYAKDIAEFRLKGKYGYPEDEPFRPTIHEDKLDLPHSWRKPTLAFVCSMSDFFHPDFPKETIFRQLDVMYECNRHIFQILTKRHDRLKQLLDKYPYEIPEHMWFGVTVENQRNADKRIPVLLDTDVPFRWLCMEPLLGPVKLGDWLKEIDWIAIGSESGKKARPMDEDWVRSIRDECREYGVPLFYKQRRINGTKISMPELDGEVHDEVPVWKVKGFGQEQKKKELTLFDYL
jgi:protein gp37